MDPFSTTVSALCYSIVRERCHATDPPHDFPHNRAVRFVIEQHGRMPEYLRLPFALVTVAFGWSSVVRYGRPFHRLRHSQRWRQVEAWRDSRFGPCRDLIKFYESFVIFFWHSTRPIPAAGPSEQDRVARGRPPDRPGARVPAPGRFLRDAGEV